MNIRSFLATASLAITPLLHAQDHQPARDYVRFTGDDKRGQLETSIVTMKNKDGVQVELVGAVHIADKSYYSELNELFKKYDALLFELVDGQSLKAPIEPPKPAEKKPGEKNKPNTAAGEEQIAPDEKPAPKKPARRRSASSEDIAFKLIGGMMTSLGSYLRLEYQTDGIDYTPDNFVHADVSLAEFKRLQEEKGESFLSLFFKAMQSSSSSAASKAAEPKPAQLLLALLGDSSGIKITMARVLGSAEESGEDLGLGSDSVIIGERNRVAMEVFDREVKAGRKNLGIFYGAGHLADIELRLEARGYERTGERWLRAWDIKPRVDEGKK